MKYLRSGFIVFVISLLCTGINAQNYKFKTLGIEQGITHPYIYSIAQDSKGYLWAGTAEGLCRFDGMNVKMFTGFNKNADNFITTSFTDSKGNTWFGHNQGGVTVYDGRNFTSIATGKDIKSPVVGIGEDANGNTWCASQNDGIFMVGKDKVPVFYKAGITGPIYSFAVTSAGELLTGTGEGISIYTTGAEGSRPELIGKAEGISTKVQCFYSKANTRSWWVGTEDEGAYLIIPSGKKGNYTSQPIGAEFGLGEENVQGILEDSERNLWLSTFGKGVYKLIHSNNSAAHSGIVHFTSDNGLPSKFVKAIFQDREGNMWLGTYGAGLSVLQDNYFTFYSPENNASSVFVQGDLHWFGTEGGLICIDERRGTQEFISCKEIPKDKITAVADAGNGSLWIGTDHSGLYKMDKTGSCKRTALAPDKLSNTVNAIVTDGSSVWVATKAGIFHFTKDDTEHFTTEQGLTHNSINHIYLDKKGDLWIAAQSNHLSVIHNGKVINHTVTSSGGVLNIVSITEDKKGNLWFATQGNGVLQFSPSTNNIQNYTSDNGLRSNYCYSVAADADGRIWVGHRTGLSRIDVNENNAKSFGTTDGITGECSLNAIACDPAGRLWVGTSSGIVKYDPSKDRKNLVPPVLNITSVKFSDKEVDANAGIELPYDVYKMRIDFSGLTFREPDRVRYQYKLEGHDIDWSELTTAGYALYNRVADGEYTFLVRAFNSDGVCNSVPQKLRVTILSPIWKRWWFMLLSTFTGGYVLFLFIGVREKRMKTLHANLQSMLDQRTYEVVKQKEELEKKNKDITDSITYAKRIQEAILPDTKVLDDVLPDSFVLYKPRDIVSGDFYWFERFGSKIVVACADATGHGVPGALMSMIGSTLLKELCMKEEIDSPAEILNALDTELCNVLKKHSDTSAQDSMDIIICEIDLITSHVRIASAMRPAIICTNGETTIFRKKQHVIGSSDSQNDPFTNSDMQLRKGDCIYLFTDGFSDQFGGENGKKLKTQRFKEYIDSIHHLPMKEQHEKLDRFFTEWTEGYEQLDDVLVMGIRL